MPRSVPAAAASSRARRCDPRAGPTPRSVLETSRPRPDGPYPSGGRRWRAAMWATPGEPGRRLWGMRMAELATAATTLLGGRRLLGPLFDRPPHDHDQRDQRDLERQHEPDESPSHVWIVPIPRQKFTWSSGSDVRAIPSLWVVLRSAPRWRNDAPVLPSRSGGRLAQRKRLCHKPSHPTQL